MPKAAPLGPVGLVEAYSKNVLRRQQQSGGRAHHRPLAPLILLLHLLVGTVGRGNVAQGLRRLAWLCISITSFTALP